MAAEWARSGRHRLVQQTHAKVRRACQFAGMPSRREKSTGGSSDGRRAWLSWATGSTDAVGAVLVPDGRAGRVDGGQREPLLGALGQVGADRGWLGRERHDSAAGTPAHSSAPRVGVDLARGLGVDGGESRSDEAHVGLGEARPRVTGRAGRDVGRNGQGGRYQGDGHRRVVPGPLRTTARRPCLSRASVEKREFPRSGHAVSLVRDDGHRPDLQVWWS